VKPDTKGSPVLEQFIRMLFYCGLPRSDIDFVVMDGPPFGEVVKTECFRCT